MNKCSDGHEEVFYEVENCPVCFIIDKVDELELDVEGYQKEIADLEDDIAGDTP